MNGKLTIAELARGLEHFGAGRYNALDVFADDVDEVRASRGGLPRHWRPLGNDGAFEVPVDGTPYFVRVFREAGVVRLSREPEPVVSNSAPEGALFGALAGAAIGAAASKKGEGLVGGLLLGLLVGAALGGATEVEPAPQRVFTMRFDPLSREWKTYNGGLVRWMKSELSGVAA